MHGTYLFGGIMCQNVAALRDAKYGHLLVVICLLFVKADLTKRNIS
jgi:hypothetical protein